MKPKKQKVIIIYGAKPLESHNKLIQKSIDNLLSRLFGYSPTAIKSQWEPLLVSFFDIYTFEWSGRVGRNQLRKAIADLSFLIKKCQTDDVLILTESIGSHIALQAIANCKVHNVIKLTAICPVNKPVSVQGFEMVIYSSQADLFARFATFILWPFHCFNRMIGNVRSYQINGMRHHDFIPEFILEQSRNFSRLIIGSLKC